MDYNKTTPCDNCPFRRGTAMQLHPGRIDEITSSILDFRGAEFPCHKTITERGQDAYGEDTDAYSAKQHCAGAIIFALKHDTMPQMMRIAERLGMLKRGNFTKNFDSVFDSVEEMQEHVGYHLCGSRARVVERERL